jgi:nucleotide-binding universal stress UspA family protein
MAIASATSSPAPTVYVVAVDGSESGDHVLDVACGLGASLGGAAELHVLHVVGLAQPDAPLVAPMLVTPSDLLEGGRTVLDRTTARAAERFPGKVIGHLGSGEPWREIIQLASGLRADLVVVGTTGRTGLARMALGSVAERVVRHAGCPVLVARPKDYQSLEGEGIEPPCPDCIKVQNESARARLWCERHSVHRPHGRLHYELPPTFAVGSMNFRP